MPNPTPPPPLPRVRETAPVALAADLLAEVGGTCCLSVSALLERLIDRHAAGGLRP